MKTCLACAGATLVASVSAAVAHHSFAMFDADHPLELVGTVQELRYIAPHTIIVLAVRHQDGNAELWKLEGGSPSVISRDGWRPDSVKPGDELRIIVEPLRSGAPFGAWDVHKVWFLDGKPVVPDLE